MSRPLAAMLLCVCIAMSIVASVLTLDVQGRPWGPIWLTIMSVSLITAGVFAHLLIRRPSSRNITVKPRTRLRDNHFVVGMSMTVLTVLCGGGVVFTVLALADGNVLVGVISAVVGVLALIGLIKIAPIFDRLMPR